jgi:integrase
MDLGTFVFVVAFVVGSAAGLTENGSDVGSHRPAITRACTRANVPAWHPHQLRHNSGTTLRKGLGIETARVVLGHESVLIIETYAERDREKAVSVMAKTG